jgi:Cdc6-like AAA superfamily ATPase
VLSGVLKLVQNDKEKVDAVFDSAAVMARFLPKYAIIEDHYRDRPTQEQKAFEDRIKEVYGAILMYSACVQKELNRSITGNTPTLPTSLRLTPTGRLLDSFWTLDNQDIKTLKEDLEAKDKIVADHSQFVAHQYRKQEFQELDGKASEALGKIDISVDLLLKAERLRTLKWLSDTPLTDKQQQLRSQVDKANANAGRWLLESTPYTHWLAESHSFAWLHGSSGCGKSSLCSTVIKSLVESAEKDTNMIVAYWYFDNADPPTQNLQRLLRLVLRRISAKASPFPEAVRDLANKHEPSDSPLSTTALVKALKETLAALEEDVFLVLDAIDEYQTGNETLRGELLDFLVELGNAQIRKLHLLVTSIPDAYIQNAFKRLQKPPAEIDVEKQVAVDVDAYLDATIKRHAKDKHWSAEITDKVHQALKGDGYETPTTFFD